MKTALRLLSPCTAFLIVGCATSPKVRYAVEAESVTAPVLEPVSLESAQLEDEAIRYAPLLPERAARELTTVIQTEIANTRRFTKVMLNSTDGDVYIIQPHIERLDLAVSPIPVDPTRRKVAARATVRLDVVFINQKNQKELVKSFYDERTLEDRVKAAPDVAQQQAYHMRVLKVAFRSAADRLGNSFNPNCEPGVVSRVVGNVAYVQINTSKLRKLPKKYQSVEVVDDDNRVLATITELRVEDGSLSGKFYLKSGGSVRVGARVCGWVNGLVE